MEYKQAKQLKDAGFPEKSDFSFRDCSKYGRGIEVQFTDEATGIHLCDIPTLSELIEACNFEMASFIELRDLKSDGWIAKGSKNTLKILEFAYGDGSTPEEAVAKLWIEMQNNK